MTWGIIAALEEEIRLITEKMDGAEVTQIAGFTYYKGTISGMEVIAVQSSIGKINAAICADILAREYQVDRLVNVGVAGSMDRKLKIYDVVVSDELVYHDINLDLYSKFFPFKRSFQADQGLVDLCSSVIGKMEGRSFDYHIGRIATGDVFVDDSALKQAIAEKAQPLCVEMEGAAIAQVAVTYGIPFLVIRSISDNADDEGGETYDNFMEKAAEYSARILIGMLEASSLQG